MKVQFAMNVFVINVLCLLVGMLFMGAVEVRGSTATSTVTASAVRPKYLGTASPDTFDPVLHFDGGRITNIDGGVCK